MAKRRLPAVGVPEPVDQLVGAAAEQVVELHDAVGQLVHGDAEQGPRLQRSEVHLDALLPALVLDQRVRVVQRRHEGGVAALGQAQPRFGAEDQRHVATRNLAPAQGLGAALDVARVVAHQPAQRASRGRGDHLPRELGRLVTGHLAHQRGKGKKACSARLSRLLASSPSWDRVNRRPPTTNDRSTGQG